MPVTAPKGPTLSVVPNPKTDTSSSGPQVLQPSGWPMPKGYANGMAADGRLVVTGGVIGWDTQGHLAPDFVAQVRQTLCNIADILAEGGARPEHLVRLTWYVVDIEEYLASLKELGRVYREILARIIRRWRWCRWCAWSRRRRASRSKLPRWCRADAGYAG